MIKNLKLRDILSFHECDLDLGPLNIVIGPNGVGKSNLLRVVQLLRALADERDGQALAAKLKDYQSHLLASSDATSRLTVCSGEYGPYPKFLPFAAELEYELSCSHGKGFSSAIESETVDARYAASDGVTESRLVARGSFETKMARRIYGDSTGPTGIQATKLEPFDNGFDSLPVAPSILPRIGTDHRPHELIDFVRDFSLLSVYTSWDVSEYGPIKKPQSTSIRQDLLSTSASNLALFFNHLQTKGDAATVIEDWMKKVNPRLKRISPSVTGNLIQLFFSEQGLRDPLPSLAMSDGTMQFLALMCALFNPDPPSMVCIEEPESSLHPEAIAILAQALREASKKTQIIVTTHSEQLVSCFSDMPECVLVTSRDHETGETVLERLDGKELEGWREEYRLGELWAKGRIGGGIE